MKVAVEGNTNFHTESFELGPVMCISIWIFKKKNIPFVMDFSFFAAIAYTFLFLSKVDDMKTKRNTSSFFSLSSLSYHSP